MDLARNVSVWIDFYRAIIDVSVACYITGTSGSDNFPGTMAQPFKTLTHARDVIRQLKNTSGEYFRTTAIM